MAVETKNYGYPKPGIEDFYDINQFNLAMDMIDEDIFHQAGSIEQIKKKINGLKKMENNEIDLIMEGIAAEEDESDWSLGTGDPVGDYEIVTEEDIRNVLSK